MFIYIYIYNIIYNIYMKSQPTVYKHFNYNVITLILLYGTECSYNYTIVYIFKYKKILHNL